MFEVGLRGVLGNLVCDKFIKTKSALKMCSLEEGNYTAFLSLFHLFFFPCNLFILGLTSASFGYAHL